MPSDSTLGSGALAGSSKNCQWNEIQKVYTGANSWSSLSEAVSREWPNFAGREGPVLVPEEYFLSKAPEVIDYNYEDREGFKCGENVEAANGATVDKLVKKMNKKYKDGKLTGDISERCFFDKIKNFFKEQHEKKATHDLTIIHGWRSKEFKSDKEREADFFIISGCNRIIINIEVKHNWSMGNARKVAEQHYLNKIHLESLLGELVGKGSGWNFVGCAAYYQHEKAPKSILDNPFVLHCDSSMTKWWRECTQAMKYSDGTSARTSYGEIVTRLVANMYLRSVNETNKKKRKKNASAPSVIATRNQASDRARRDFEDKVGTAKNVIMWTRQQYRVLYSHEKRVLLRGAYDTGKTILLREKCGELAQKYPKMQFLYVITLTQLIEETDTLLYHDLTNYFKENNHLNVSVIKVLGLNQASLDSSQFSKELRKRVKGLKIGGIFVDEFDDLCGSLKHLLQSVNSIMEEGDDSSHKGYFWIAMRHHADTGDVDGEFPSTLRWAETYFAASDRFSVISLDEVLRSSRVVVKEAYAREPEACNPLNSELASRRVWTEGICVKMDSRPPEEFDVALAEAVDELPSKDDILVHFVETPRYELKEELSKNGKNYLERAKMVLLSKGLPCTIFSEKKDSFDLEEARLGAIICSDGEVAGTEFKSLIYVCRDYESGDCLRYVDVISRCVVNLVFVQIMVEEKVFDSD